MLGRILSELADDDRAGAVLMELGDIVLVAGIESACAQSGDSLGEYASAAVRRFANAASDDDWLALMTALNNSEDPARSGLVTMLRWALSSEARAGTGTGGGCSCGGGCST